MFPFFALFVSSLKCDPVELESNKSKNSFCVVRIRLAQLVRSLTTNQKVLGSEFPAWSRVELCVVFFATPSVDWDVKPLV